MAKLRNVLIKNLAKQRRRGGRSIIKTPVKRLLRAAPDTVFSSRRLDESSLHHEGELSWKAGVGAEAKSAYHQRVGAK